MLHINAFCLMYSYVNRGCTISRFTYIKGARREELLCQREWNITFIPGNVYYPVLILCNYNMRWLPKQLDLLRLNCSDHCFFSYCSFSFSILPGEPLFFVCFLIKYVCFICRWHKQITYAEFRFAFIISYFIKKDWL